MGSWRRYPTHHTWKGKKGALSPQKSKRRKTTAHRSLSPKLIGWEHSVFPPPCKYPIGREKCHCSGNQQTPRKTQAHVALLVSTWTWEKIYCSGEGVHNSLKSQIHVAIQGNHRNDLNQWILCIFCVYHWFRNFVRQNAMSIVDCSQKGKSYEITSSFLLVADLYDTSFLWQKRGAGYFPPSFLPLYCCSVHQIVRCLLGLLVQGKGGKILCMCFSLMIPILNISFLLEWNPNQ